MERFSGFLTSPLSILWTTCTVLILAAFSAVWKVKERKKMSSIADRIAVVAKERDEDVQWAKKESELVNEGERKKIQGMTFKQLHEALQSGAVSAEAVIRVYYALAIKAHEATNCLTGIIKEALTEAQKMDKDSKRADYKKTPLWGLPLSVKDSVMVKGHRSTWGLVKWMDAICAEDSFPIIKLRAAGMIPFAKTNNPTSCMTWITDNRIFGVTVNPHSPSRTCGGSSGGEGALIGSMGSLIGIGSDLGGSIRLPAAYSGCCGFKPSATRFSSLQHHEPAVGRPMVMPTEGPLAQDPHAIVQIMRSIWSDLFLSNQDALSVPVDFREDLFKEGTVYRIGYYSSDGYIDPLPGNQRVVREAVQLLQSKGHSLVPFSLGDIPFEMARGVFSTVFAHPLAMSAILKDEPLSPEMERLRTAGKMPLWFKTALGWYFKMRGDQSTADFFLSQSPTASDMRAGIDLIYANRKRLVAKMKAEDIDLILCPSTISPAMPLSLLTTLPATAFMPTILWNAADFPAGVVTTGKWTEMDEREMERYPARGLVEKVLKQGCKNNVGLPLAVQIVGPTYRDESVLRVCCDLFDAVKEKEESQQKK